MFFSDSSSSGRQGVHPAADLSSRYFLKQLFQLMHYFRALATMQDGLYRLLTEEATKLQFLRRARVPPLVIITIQITPYTN